jgi:hypothetical protein
MGVLAIVNLATGIMSLLPGVVTELIAIKNALGQTGSNFQATITSLDGDIVQTTGDTAKDAEAWLAAHPATL